MHYLKVFKWILSGAQNGKRLNGAKNASAIYSLCNAQKKYPIFWVDLYKQKYFHFF